MDARDLFHMDPVQGVPVERQRLIRPHEVLP